METFLGFTQGVIAIGLILLFAFTRKSENTSNRSIDRDKRDMYLDDDADFV